METQPNISSKINLLDYHNILEHEVMLSYKGSFHANILAILGKYVESFIMSSPNVSRKAFKIFIELAQNIAYYSAERTREEKSTGIGTIAIGESEEYYTFATGNLVKNLDIISIIERIEIINSLDRESLRKYKIDQRRVTAGEIKGSHIGLIQVALTSSQPLDIEVIPVDTDHSFFTISVKINKDSLADANS